MNNNTINVNDMINYTSHQTKDVSINLLHWTMHISLLTAVIETLSHFQMANKLMDMLQDVHQRAKRPLTRGNLITDRL